MAPAPRAALTRYSSITLALRESLDWLLDPAPECVDGLTGAMAEIMQALSTRGACFQSDLIAHTRRLPSDVEEALWTLAANGLVTSDSVIPLRARVDGKQRREKQRRGRADYKSARNNGKVASSPLRARINGSEPPASYRGAFAAAGQRRPLVAVGVLRPGG